MKNRILPIFLFVCILSGCGGVTILPSPKGMGKINAQDMSISQTNEQVSVTAKIMDIEVRPYQMQQNICSFKVLISNNRNEEISLPADNFLLSDSKGNQFLPVSPAKIKELVADHDPYLIPYPYVGYYYEGDAERGMIRNGFNREVTYFPTKNPQNIVLDALPDVKIEPGKQVSGLIYFLTDLRAMDGFTLEGAAVLSKGVKSSKFIFSFSVVKK
ncbi:hypothetical protein [Geopsychrobacter electrodiphilus]|uniref:hypothetical protein n=1 Tax=Geopsychrobacter electrodiphilus TaxID=225196 RepID=UPI0004764A12|nr:hypothetical protein [Geopsychrobacter electrodiphilus]